MRPTNYLYDGVSLIEELDSSGNVATRYTPGHGVDEPLAQFRAGSATYYHADALGSVTSLTSVSATPAATYNYDAFGNLSLSTGSLANALRYSGREPDQETGLYFYRARYYDPQIGRFVSEDPIGFDGGLNYYRYNANDPVNYVDPLGLKPVKPCKEACEEAARSRLRIKLSSIAGNPRDAYVYYELTGNDNQQDYLVFQAESNPDRASATEYGPGSYDDHEFNVFSDHIQPNPYTSTPSDSSQTFWVIPIRRRPNNAGYWKLGPPQPVLVRDRANHDFCNLKVLFDPRNATINGNLVTEHLTSFSPPRK